MGVAATTNFGSPTIFNYKFRDIVHYLASVEIVPFSKFMSKTAYANDDYCGSNHTHSTNKSNKMRI